MPAASAPAHHRPDPRLALPRQPEASALHVVVSAHARTFLDSAEERGGVPRFVERELLRFLRCGGRMKIIATVTDPKAVRKILACIGLPARSPPTAPAREREQAELSFGA